MKTKEQISKNIEKAFKQFQDENGAWLDGSGLEDTNISYDIIINGNISDTFKTAPNQDIAKLTQFIAESRNLDIRSFHLCNLRFK